MFLYHIDIPYNLHDFFRGIKVNKVYVYGGKHVQLWCIAYHLSFPLVNLYQIVISNTSK
jgi:hypothetical protein